MYLAQETEVPAQHIDKFREQHCSRITVGIAIDVNPELEEHYENSIYLIQNVMIPRMLNKYSKSHALRIGASFFSEQINPIWNGFRSLSKIKNDALSLDFIRKTNPKNSRLYAAMLEQLQLAANATIKLNKENPSSDSGKIIIFVLTSGIDKVSSVCASNLKKITDLIENKDQIVLGMIHMKTANGLSDEEFNSVAKVTGFDHFVYHFDGLKDGLMGNASNSRFIRFIDAFFGKTYLIDDWSNKFKI